MKNIKRERFEKVAAKRVENILHYFGLLGNCANTNNYEYNSNDVEKMFKEIQKALNTAKNRFEVEMSKNKRKFNF